MRDSGRIFPKYAEQKYARSRKISRHAAGIRALSNAGCMQPQSGIGRASLTNSELPHEKTWQRVFTALRLKTIAVWHREFPSIISCVRRSVGWVMVIVGWLSQVKPIWLIECESDSLNVQETVGQRSPAYCIIARLKMLLVNWNKRLFISFVFVLLWE